MKIHSLRKVMYALDCCADLCSEASPNQQTDPKSAWARRRAVKNMTKSQQAKFALHALTVLEFVQDNLL